MFRRTTQRLALQLVVEPLPHEVKTSDRGAKTFKNLTQSQTLRAGIVGALFVTSGVVSLTAAAPETVEQ